MSSGRGPGNSGSGQPARRQVALKSMAGTSGSGMAQGEGSKRNSSASGGRKYASRACCDGNPCSSCRKEGVACVMDLQSDQRRQMNRTSRNARDRLQEKLVDVMRCAPLSDAQLMFEAIRHDSVPAQLETLADQLLSKVADVSDTNGFDHDGSFQLDGSQLSDIVDDNDQDLAASELSYTAAAGSCDHTDDDVPSVLSASSWPAVGIHIDRAQILQAMLSFVEAARSQLASGMMDPVVSLSLTGLDLDLFFRDRMASDAHTVSTWAYVGTTDYNG
ncbi:uncharacterized protein AB675_1101 [Cyphellophora attinorum]|uniref:Uncharacterized protein n=1 Tax=Cyphellophora attinorum TaxID=1664694 RepID=A0A0N1NZ33_9EURO|nr:uncharacterized protein AB675_1101 [Phialophora attinorum]KPI38125.1 hypothetical protein AB675_1101 [Phialophora attinorum]